MSGPIAGVTIIAVHPYAGHARKIANRIKNAADDDALDQAAEEMAPMVPEGAILVPAPSSSGLNKAMLVLARKIADMTGSKVAELVLRKRPVPSSLLLRRAGKRGVPLADHLHSMALSRRPPAKGRLIAVDNVVTTGTTLKAMRRILSRDIEAVVYADARRTVRDNIGEGPLRVCVSGSRGFRNLWKVGSVLSSVPKGSVIVHGGAVGVDAEAAAVAEHLGLGAEVWRPEWPKYGRRAGPMRNREMVRSCHFLYAFWDGESRGTASAIAEAVRIGLEHEVILDD